MFCSRLLLPPLLAVAIVALAGALYMPSGQTTSSAQLSQASPSGGLPNQADLAALQVLDRALDSLSSTRVTWIDATVWQQLQLEDMTCQAEGRYVAGPNRCFSLDLTTTLGTTKGRMLVVSDGLKIRQATRVANYNWSSSEPIALSKGAPDHSPVEAKHLKLDAFLKSQLAGGLPTLMKEMREQLVWVQRESVRRQGRHYFKLTATVPRATGVLPGGTLKQARLYLDAQTLWPHRLEWWGTSERSRQDVLLLQMELRNPVLNRPLSPNEIKQTFAFDVPVGK